MTKYSLLQNYKKENFFEKPFPHLIINNALPEEIYNELSQSVPNELVNNIEKNNSRGNIFINDVFDNPKYKVWADFLSYNQSEDFFNQILNIFNKEIEKIHPGILKKVEKMNKVPKHKKNYEKDKNNLGLNSYYCYNTPVQKISSVRGVHLDFFNKLHIGLFYLRSKNDESKGGNLALYEWNKNYNLAKKKKILFTEKIKYLDQHTEKIKEIPYNKNTFFLAINSIDAIHSVTARDRTNHIRQFCYLYSEVNFDLSNFKPSLIEKLSYDNISLFQKIKILLLDIKVKFQKILS